jgi:hypothetical protein
MPSAVPVVQLDSRCARTHGDSGAQSTLKNGNGAAAGALVGVRGHGEGCGELESSALVDFRLSGGTNKRWTGTSSVFKRRGILKQTVRPVTKWVRCIETRLCRPLKERKAARLLHRFVLPHKCLCIGHMCGMDWH